MSLSVFFSFTVPNTLTELVVAARAHGEWDARYECKYYTTTITCFGRNRPRFPPLITITDENGPNADQVTVPVGQKPFVWHTAPDVVDQLSANTDIQHKRPVQQQRTASEPTNCQEEWVTYKHARLPAKEDQQ